MVTLVKFWENSKQLSKQLFSFSQTSTRVPINFMETKKAFPIGHSRKFGKTEH